MFFEDKMEYWEVCPEWSEEKVESKADELGVDLPADSIENRWARFAHVLGAENGLDIVEATSMASVISGFMAGLPVSAGTEMYFNEDSIDSAVIDKLNSLDRSVGELEVRRELLAFILELYVERIGEYALKTENLNFRVSRYTVDLFDDLPGRTRADKFQFLLDSYFE